jgi:6,7-dimethyl-8-ribityllumazine synthase|tara:strand:- start:835 stop:1251 length:417 start_codon:yes stop_codon:yes gene_type:complete
MADLYGQVVRGDGVSTYTVGANNQKAAQPLSNMGTRELTFLTVTAGGDTPFAVAQFTTAGGSADAVVKGIAVAGAEVYHFQRVSDTVMALTLGLDTSHVYDADGTTVGYGVLEAAIKAAENAASSNSTNFTIAAATFS